MADKKDYTVKMKIGDAEVEIQGAETGVVKIVEAISDVLRGSRRAAQMSPVSSPAVASTPAARSSTDIRSFFAEKQPSSDIEAAAAAAYYYQYLVPEADRKATIDSAALQEAFRLANRPLPAKTIWTLTNARNAGYLDSVGEGGQFRLNPVGYNLVEHGLGTGGGTDRGKQKKKVRGRKKRSQAKRTPKKRTRK